MKKFCIACFLMAILLATVLVVVNAGIDYETLMPLIFNSSGSGGDEGEEKITGNPYPPPYPPPIDDPTPTQLMKSPTAVGEIPTATSTPHSIEPPKPPTATQIPPTRPPVPTDTPEPSGDWWCDEHPDDPRCKRTPPTPFTGTP